MKVLCKCTYERQIVKSLTEESAYAATLQKDTSRVDNISIITGNEKQCNDIACILTKMDYG